MSRDPLLPPADDPGPDPPAGPARVGPTPAAAVAVPGLVGLVGGWVLRPLSLWMDRPAPQVGWMPAFALLLVASLVGYTAWTTHRSLQRRHPRRDLGLPPIRAHQAVNRLALAKASVMIGALVTGGYLGFCISWVGLPAQIAVPKLLRGLLAALAGALLVIAALLLERACRVRNDED